MTENKRVSYPVWKHGGLVEAYYRGSGTFKKQTTHDLLDDARIFAVDTETSHRQELLVTDLIPVAWPERDQLFSVDDPSESETPLCRLLDEVVTRYGVPMGSPSLTEQRPRLETDEERGPKRRSRHGRRLKLPLALSVWFNLPYDVSRLFPEYEQLRRIYAGADSYRMKISDRFEIEWLRYIDTAAPQFSWYVRDYKHHVIAHLAGLDLTGYWKCSLDAALNAVGRKGKDDLLALADDIHERDYSLLLRKEISARRTYALRDGRGTRELYQDTLSLLFQLDPRVIRKTGTIPPSAPGAAARIMFSLAFDLHPTVEEWKKPPVWADTLGSEAYYGGRAFCAKPGRHERMVTLDLKSAYPYVMTQLPDPVTATYQRITGRTFDLDDFKGKWGVLRVNGECLDDVYPATRIHEESRLRYVVGKFEAFSFTIPELVMGVARGALTIDRIITGVVIEGSPDKSFMRRFVLERYAMKEKYGKEPLGQLSKLLMNSSYGKLVEINDQEYRWDGCPPIPCWPQHRQDIAQSLLHILVHDGAVEAADLFFGRHQDPEVLVERQHMFVGRSSRAESGLDFVVAYAEVLEACFGLPAYVEPLSRYLRAATSYSVGNYFMPLYGAQITGFVSAQLGMMARCVDALTADTDSAHFVLNAADPLSHPGISRYHELMATAGYASPRAGEWLVEDTTLGTWAAESPCPSEESFLARPKKYSHRFRLPGGHLDTCGCEVCRSPIMGIDHDKKKCLCRFCAIEHKQATHAMSRFTTERAEEVLKSSRIKKELRLPLAKRIREYAAHELMRKLARGETIDYVMRAAPRKGRTTARTGETAGEFVRKEQTVTNAPVQGTRLDEAGWVRWEETGT